MTKNDLILRCDGVCVYATTILKAGTIGKCILFFINLLMLSMITAFSVKQLFLPALVFFAFELFVFKYTLWNLFGEERLIINAKSLSYQQHYGFFTTSFHTINFNKRITIVGNDEVIEGDKTYLKFLFESYDENNLPNIIYYSVLHVPEADFGKLVQQVDRLFIDEIVRSYDMPMIYLN